MSKENKVEIAFILDETGSMAAIKKDAYGGYNQFVKEQKVLSADVVFTLIMFSYTGSEETFRPKYEAIPLNEVEELTEESYRPRGRTPLLDAIGGTIDSVGVRLADMPEGERPNQVIVVVMTDGLENASREYSLEKVKGMVEHQKEKYNWDFVFLGANMDAIFTAGSMGFDANTSFNYVADSYGTQSAYRQASRTVSSLVEKDEKRH